jgi:plastocyanin
MKMLHRHLIAALLGIAVGTGGAWVAAKHINAPLLPEAVLVAQDAVPPDAVVILMSQTNYSPATITIPAGTTVAFINESSGELWPASNIHPTHGLYPEFDPRKPVPPGMAWTFTFATPGTWPMHDHIQPNIVGTIFVE